MMIARNLTLMILAPYWALGMPRIFYMRRADRIPADCNILGLIVVIIDMRAVLRHMLAWITLMET